MTESSDTKTLGFTPLIYCDDAPLFHVSAGVPVDVALSKASDLLSLSKAFAQDAAFQGGNDRHAWAAYYLSSMGKAIIDDVVKAVSPRPNLAKMQSVK
ncbi:DUF3077 domain-containing protein [Pseudomonas prosekii]|uniref:DUF3077 domain-containing protein n=1 Tax=Pseudomonas prosekii TaxID=1148509 RepID=UPI00387A8BF8